MNKGSYVFTVRSYECGPDGRATLPTVCNYLQESASLNAAALGFNMTDFAAAGKNVTWVLGRLVVRMTRYPKWGEAVTVETFPRGGRKIVAWRDFELKDASGGRLGVASSEWMLIDLSTRRIVAIPERVFELADREDAPVLGDAPFSKFRFPDGGERTAPQAFRAQKSHIDLNGHVNNVHYVTWMLEPCAEACPAEMEIVFRSEALAGAEVGVETVWDGQTTYHRVYGADGADHVLARTVPTTA